MYILFVPWVRILPLPFLVNLKNVKTYRCKIWFGATNLNTLKCWMLLLPFKHKSTGLKVKINRFTLLRSPLGNKRAKDQFERREHKTFVYLESTKPGHILAFLDVLKGASGIKAKVLVQST